MSGQVPERVKRQRRDRLMTLQREIARETARSWVGRTLRVLTEREVRGWRGGAADSREHGLVRETGGDDPGWAGRLLVARGEADAPDIDGRVYVRGRLPVGEFAMVNVVGHSDYDLLAEA